jgi:hypothetical protein
VVGGYRGWKQQTADDTDECANLNEFANPKEHQELRTRRRSCLVLVSALVVVLLTSPAARAFKPVVHGSVTTESLELIEAHVGKQTYRFSRRALKEIKAANKATDALLNLQFWGVIQHFDDEQFWGASLRLIELRQIVVELITEVPPHGKEARQWLGSALHTVQDFYAHSSWIETHPGILNHDLGRDTFSGPDPDVQTCGGFWGTDLCCEPVVTSGYFQFTLKVPRCGAPAGKCQHGLDVDGVGVICPDGINKDGAFRPNFEPAHDRAVEATTDFVTQILEAPGVAGNARAIKALMDVSTVAFVIDDQNCNMAKPEWYLPGSNHAYTPILDAIKQGVVQTVRNLQAMEDPPEEYILERFNDHSVGPVFETDDVNAFIARVNTLVSGQHANGYTDCDYIEWDNFPIRQNCGIDGCCRGKSDWALQQVIERVDSNADVYLITSLRPESQARLDTVTHLANTYGVTVNPVLIYPYDPECGFDIRINDRTTINEDPSYIKLAADTGGTIELPFDVDAAWDSPAAFANVLKSELGGDSAPPLPPMLSAAQLAAGTITTTPAPVSSVTIVDRDETFATGTVVDQAVPIDATVRQVRFSVSLSGLCAASPIWPGTVTCPGDADRNGFVNSTDYEAVRAHLGETTSGQGDADCNGVVDAADLAAVQANFGRRCSTPVTPQLDDVHVVRPSGSIVHAGEPEVIMAEPGATIITAPEPGMWHLSWNGAGRIRATVVGKSSLAFDSFHFVEWRGRPAHEGWFPISGQPLAGSPATVVANVFGPFVTATFEFADVHGARLGNTLNLASNDSTVPDEFSGTVDLPTQPFRAVATGTDANGFTYRRIFPALFRPQTVEVSPENTGVRLPTRVTTPLHFTIHNRGSADTFDVTATDAYGFVQHVASPSLTLDTGASAEVAADVLVPDSALDATSLSVSVTARSATDPTVTNRATVVIPVVGLPNPFLCYRTVTPRSTVPPLRLVTEFADITAMVTGPKYLCAPAIAEGWGLIDTAMHLESYTIHRAGLPAGGDVRQPSFKVVDLLGGAVVDVGRPDWLLVPSATDLTTSPPPPDPGTHTVDHYECYKAKTPPGAPRVPKGLLIHLGDEFTAPAKLYSVLKPAHLCAPVDQNGAGIKRSAAHLICYKIKPAPLQPARHRQPGIHVNNEFGAHLVDTSKEAELCLPAVNNP